MTEGEATTQRCPRKFTLFNDRCEGAACMAWRWQISGLVMAFEESGARKFVAPAGEHPHGFCGLAGQP